MSVTSSSDDPVQAVIDLLSGTSSSNWPNGPKPTYIETSWETDYQTKANRADPAVYVRSPEDGTIESFSARSTIKDESETVVAAVWATDDSTASDIAGDVVSILEDYWNDRQANTQFHRIRPRRVNDARQEHVARQTDHYTITVRVHLRRERSIGT
jgi:hypothetical protein